MGTTLTGLTPATTYDALIKVGDNGPLSATAKYVGDGLGNDSVVALSTSSVGIGTTSPTQLLHVAGNVRITGALYDGNNAAGTSGQILSSTGTGTDWVSKSDLSLVDGSGTANYVSKWSDTDTLTNSVIYDNGTNVGVGTTSPNRLLTIKNSSDGVNGLSFQSYASTSELGYIRYEQTNDILDIVNTSGFASGGIKFSTSNTERLRITSAGKVGIGTTNVPYKFNVYDTSDAIVGHFAGGSSNYTLVSFLSNEPNVYSTSLGSFNSGLLFRTSEVDRMYINSSGNVGIGTNSPTAGYKLDVAGRTKAYNAGYIADFVSTESNASAIQLYADNTNVSIVQGGTAAVPLTFFVGGSERMRITASGNVGIGTASPAGNLHIASAADTGIRIQAGASSLSYIDLADTASGTPAGSIAYNHIVNAITFATGTNVERARIDSDGLKFNGDTAAANALDDYEEGTFTATLTPSTSGTITLSVNTCTYTKIGRQVTVKGFLTISSVASPVGASVDIGGLPFTIINSTSGRGTFSFVVLDASAGYTAFTGPTQHTANSTSIIAYYDASTLAASDEIMFTATYFV